MDSEGAEEGKARILANQAPGLLLEKDVVQWGGAAVLLEQGNPVTAMASSHLQAFQNCLLRELGKQSDYPFFRLKGISTVVGQDIAAPIIMMVVLQEEGVSHLNLGVGRKTRYEITGQLLFLDTTRAMQATAAYPIAVGVEDLDVSNLDDLVETALLTEKRDAVGKAIGLVGQVVDMLQNEAIAPRALFPPVSVNPFVLPEMGIIPVEWKDQLAGAFSTYLGANTGFPMNPYLKEGSDGSFRSNSVLSQAASFTMRTVDNQIVKSGLTPSRHTIGITFSKVGFSETQDKGKRKTFETVFCYAFDAIVTLNNADTGKPVAEVRVHFGSGVRGLGRLREKYAAISEVTLLNQHRDNPEVHRQNLHTFMEEALLQIAREMAFEVEDKLDRFDLFRATIRRNS